MNEDEQLRERFQRVGFTGEPPMASTAGDDLTRGRQHLRRRRAATLGGGVLGVTALAVGVAFALPGGGTSGPSGSEDLQVAGSGSATESPVDSTTSPAPPDVSDEPPGFGFPLTRQLLLDTAVEHLDPAHEHLPAESTGFTGGGTNVGTKLDWVVDGDDGLGLVQVAVTGPDYADESEFALVDFAVNIGCDPSGGRCTEQPIPGTDETALVGAADPDQHLLFSIVYERADGSLVGIAVSDLFGNNSLTPLAEMDVSLEQGFAFVTDPDLQVDPDEADDAPDDPTTAPAEGSDETPLPED